MQDVPHHICHQQILEDCEHQSLILFSLTSLASLVQAHNYLMIFQFIFIEAHNLKYLYEESKDFVKSFSIGILFNFFIG